MSPHNEIRIEDFQFQSLRRFMSPLYWRLRHAELLSDEEKKEVIRRSIREFFIRLRKFRQISIEEISDSSSFSAEEIAAFERGDSKSKDLEQLYCKRFHAWHELEYFETRIRECQNPEIRTQKQAIAKDLLKRHGIILPDVDLFNSKSQPADIICIESRTSKKEI